MLGALLVGLAVASVLSTAPASGRLARLQGTTLHVQRLEAALALELGRGRLGVLGDAELARLVERVRSASNALEREVRHAYGEEVAALSTLLERQRQAVVELDDATEALLRESRALRRTLDRIPARVDELEAAVPDFFAEPGLVRCLAALGRDLLEIASTPVGGDLEWVDDDLAELAELRAGARGGAQTALVDLEGSLGALRGQLERVAEAAANCRSFEVSGSAGRIFDACTRIEQASRSSAARRQIVLTAATAALCVVLVVGSVRVHGRARLAPVPLVALARRAAAARGEREAAPREPALAARPADGGHSEEAALPPMRSLPSVAPARPSEGQAVAPEAPADLGGRRLLVAEDGRDNQRLMHHLLARTGADVTIVDNGVEAVRAALEGELAERPFDLVLMDMSMPVKDGYRATEELRAAGFARPIVALTAHALPEDRERCLAAGCDEYLTKPVDRATLHGILRDLVERCAPSRPQPSADAPDDGPIVSEFSDDEEMLELIEWFVRDLHRDVEEIERVLDSDDIARLEVLAHQLKGSAGSYGFPQLTAQADRIEACLREGGERERLDAEVRVFLALCGRTRAS